MKKIIIRILIGLAVLVVLAALVLRFFLDSAIKKGVETVGPMVTKVEIKLDSVSVSVLSGSGKVKGLVVGNPEGFKTASAINVGHASLALQPSSLLGDKIVVKSVRVEAPEITYETDFKANNLSKILANVQAFTGGAQKPPAQSTGPAPAEKPAKKLQVDDFLISGGKIHVSATALVGQKLTVALPEIHLTGLGQGPEGITAAELTEIVIKEIEKVATQAAAGSVSDLGKLTQGLGKDLGKSTGTAVEKATKGFGDIFKKKN